MAGCVGRRRAGNGHSPLQTPDHAARFREKVTLQPLPMPALTRRIALSARRDVLGQMPADIAARLRVLLQDMIVAPVVAEHPWLADGLRIIGP